MCENMSYLCRLCLKESEFRFSLFSGNILHKIESLTAIKIRKDDKLPQTCCEACVANLYTSYKFQQCIIHSNKSLCEKLSLTESHIIEQAKQAPDLFEVLHLDGPSNSSSAELVEAELKNENIEQPIADLAAVEPKIEFIDESDYVHEDCKLVVVKKEDSTSINPNLGTLWQNSGSLENCNSSELYNGNAVEFANVDNFADTLKTLEATGDLDNIYNDLNIKDVDRKSTLIDFIDSINATETDAINKGWEVKEKYKKKLEILKGRRKIAENDSVSVDNPEEVLLKLGIQNKFDKKFAAYRQKQKVNQAQLQCADCDKNFETKRMLQRHMMKHKIDKCPFCFITMRSDNLKRHIQIHTDSPEVCEICGKIAKNKESLRGHVNYQHKNTETVKCEPCNREFKSNHHYKAHVRKIHLGIRNHQCHICGKKFFANHDLNKHINMTHRGARPFICQYCKKGFSSRYARKTHIRQHTLETPYRCEICAAGFRQKVSLVTHLKSKHSIITKKCDISDPKE